MTLQKITNKQQEILTLLYQFRFLNRIQIQALFKHKNKKTINLWLQDLNQKEYIGRIYSTKAGENMKPAIYYLSLNGIRYLKKIGYLSEELKKLYREKERSENFIAKQLLIADIWLDLQNKSDDKIKFSAATGSDLSDPDYKYNFLAEIEPDLVFMKETKGMKKYYLVEIFESTLPLYSMRKRIRNYFDFYFSNSWEDNVKEVFPAVFLICPTTSILIYIKRYVKKLFSDHDGIEMTIQFATQQEAEEHGITSEIWEEISSSTNICH